MFLKELLNCCPGIPLDAGKTFPTLQEAANELPRGFAVDEVPVFFLAMKESKSRADHLLPDWISERTNIGQKVTWETHFGKEAFRKLIAAFDRHDLH